METLAIILAAVVVTLAVVVVQQRRRLARPTPPGAATAAVPGTPGDSVFAVMPISGLRVNAANQIIEANARTLERFPHVAAGMGVLDAFGEHRLAEMVAHTLDDGEPRSEQLRLFSSDRRTYRVQVERRRHDGAPEALVYLTDLTEAVAYEELRSQFVANVSHELRTPLTGLGGLLEALDDPDLDEDTHSRFVARASAEIRRLDALITDILFLSQLESEPSRSHRDHSDLRDAILRSAHSLADLAQRQDVTMVLPDGPPVLVPLTEGMAETVVRNLLENAVRYAGPQATATVTVEPADGPEGRGGSWVRLAVADDGVGIPERHLAHVFERFYRADPSRSKQMGGTGLGLSIVKHIVERFGGHVAAESREGFGTTVSVTLPVAAASRGSDATGEEAQEDGLVG